MGAILGHAGLLLNVYDADAQTLFERFASPPSATIKGKINTLITTLKDEGIWALLDSLYVPAKAGEQQGGLCDWKRPTKAATLAGGATWSNDYGFVGDGNAGSYVSMDFIPSSDGVNFTLNNASHGGYINTASAQVSCTYWGCNSASNTLTRFQRASSLTHYASLFTTTAGSAADTTTLNVVNKFIVGHRAGSGSDTTCNLYIDGSASAFPDTADGVAVPSVTMYCLARNNNGASIEESTGKISAWYAGAALTVGQQQAFNTALEVYLA